MKRLLIGILLILISLPSVGFATSKSMLSKTFKTDQISLRIVSSQKGMGTVESFSSMIHRTKPIAAINGTFFAAYEKDRTKQIPYGVMLTDGKLIRTGANPVFILWKDGTVTVSHVKIGVMGLYRSQQTEDWLAFQGYTVNRQGMGIYTREFADHLPADQDSVYVVVENKRVTQLTQDRIRIPKAGFVVKRNDRYDRYENGQLGLVSIGDELDYEPLITDQITGATYRNAAIETVIGAGPVLLRNGKVDVNFDRDGAKDPKIRTGSGNRSFICYKAKSREIMIGVHPGIKIIDLAKTLRKQGCTEALNLDGGASSALYANRQIQWKAGRLLSNALLITKRTDALAKVASKELESHEIISLRHNPFRLSTR